MLLVADEGVPGACRDEMTEPLLLAVTPTVESGMLFLGDWREAFEDTAWFGTEEAVVELVVLGTKRWCL